ncbi:MAG TPA: hypothetical protein DE060_05960 [Lentisphaeria bacterium]|nr:hypothetical protein [Lentisphaeria bacterium]
MVHIRYSGKLFLQCRKTLFLKCCRRSSLIQKKADLPDVFRVSEKIIESELKKYFSQVSYSRKGIFL